MNAITGSLYLTPVLPWAGLDEEDRRYYRILLTVAMLFLVLSVAVPWLPVFQIEQPPVAETPTRYAQLLLERQPPIPVAPPVAQEVTPEPVPVEKAAPDPKAAQKQPGPPGPGEARQQAERSGVLAMRESLAALREGGSAGKLQQGPLSAGVGKGAPVERSIITSNVAGGSGGINTSGLSRGIGGGGTALSGHSTGQVSSPVGGLEQAAGRRGGRSAGRTNEEIQLVFDQNKSAIYALYNRALRSNAGLQGKVVLKLTIAPSGEVTGIDMVSSELADKELERRLLLRIRGFNFGQKDVPTVTVTYPIDFFPS